MDGMRLSSAFEGPSWSCRRAKGVCIGILLSLAPTAAESGPTDEAVVLDGSYKQGGALPNVHRLSKWAPEMPIQRFYPDSPDCGVVKVDAFFHGGRYTIVLWEPPPRDRSPAWSSHTDNSGTTAIIGHGSCQFRVRIDRPGAN